MFNFNFNLGDSFPNVTDWIQAFCAIIVMICTIIMTVSAIIAYKNWKEQKHYDIYLKALANSRIYIRIIGKSLLEYISIINNKDLLVRDKVVKINNTNSELFNTLHSNNFFVIIKLIEEITKSGLIEKSKLDDINKKYQHFLETYNLKESKLLDFRIDINSCEDEQLLNYIDELKNICHHYLESLAKIGV